jgi:hypothetical protein
MGNINNLNNNQAFIDLYLDVNRYIHSDKNSHDYIANRKSTAEKIEVFNVVQSNMNDKLKSREICDFSIDIVASLFNKNISKENNLSILIPTTVHRITFMGESKPLSSHINYVDNLFFNKKLQNKYEKWNIDKDDSSLLEKLGQLSSIHANSGEISLIDDSETKTIKKERKDTKGTKGTNSTKKIKITHIRRDVKLNTQNTKPRAKTLLDHLTKGRSRKV